tara:strand:+ start:9579 stop:10190 length:612 start_codon:yes stop_codon:yes gene_type:complete
MSSIKLKHASGNSMSIAAPATNPASDLELKLPATVGTANQYLKNSSTAGTLEFGSLSTGVVLQVVQTVDNTTADITSTSYVDAGSLSVSITPASSSNKILIMAITNIQAYVNAHELNGGLKLLRGSTDIIEYPYSHVLEAGTSGNGRIFYNFNHSAHFLDSPSTTSATTYKIQGKVYSSSNGMKLSYNQNSSKSVITAMEIAA